VPKPKKLHLNQSLPKHFSEDAGLPRTKFLDIDLDGPSGRTLGSLAHEFFNRLRSDQI